MSAQSVSATDFASLGLAAPLVATLASLGYEEATPVQREAIPLMLSGRSLAIRTISATPSGRPLWRVRCSRHEFLLVPFARSGGMRHLDGCGSDVEHVKFFCQRLRHGSHFREIACDQVLTHRRACQLETAGPEIRDGRQRADLDLLPGELLD